MAEFQPIPMLGRITTAAEARYLVRMAGLPLFLAGCAGLFALLTLNDGVTLAITSLTSLALIALGLALRGGATWPVPIALILSLAWLIWAISTTAKLWSLGFVTLGIVVPAIWAVIAGLLLQTAMISIFGISGLRGWLWLIRHRPSAQTD